MGRFPARERHSETGRTSQTPQDSMDRISSKRSAATSSGGKTAPVMSSRKCCEPPLPQRPPELSGHAGPLGSSSAGSPKLTTSAISASSISTSAAGSVRSAASAASLCSSCSPAGASSEGL
eukprot:4671454-Alexandrium_andersonii.AAC.1